jgi:mycothiol synthase
VVEVRTLATGEPDEARVAHALADAALAADGHPAVGDAVWRDLEHPTPTGLGVVATVDGAPVGYLHAATDGGTVERATTLSLIVDPAHRGAGVGDALVQRAVESLAGRGGPPSRLQLWIFGAGECADRFATDLGFASERELRQMRVALPLPEPDPRWPEGVTVRSFVPGHDDATWLEVNNRSFAADPDQSGWDQAMLDERMQESWFDPTGFLLAFDGRGLAGFCWTKVHAADPPREPEPLGEIYVIGADPERQGLGLGRGLVVAGLAALHERGIRTGMLFVDAANEPAVRLYEKLGFTTARVDRAYGRDA